MRAPDTHRTWLDDHRREAAERFAAAPAPDNSAEVWRYGRIEEVDLAAYSAVAASATDVEPVDDFGAALVVVRDGWVTRIERSDSLGSARVERLIEHSDGEALLGSIRGDGRDAVAELHDSAVGDPVIIDVPRGVHVEKPIIIDTYSNIDNGLTSPHTIIRVGENASVKVLERRRSGDCKQLVVPSVEIDVAPSARAGYLVVQQLGPNTVCLEHHSSKVAKQANLVAALAAFGGSYARTRSDLELVGRGANGDLLAAYFGDGEQMLDFRTFQEHLAPDTTSNLLFKGAVTGSAKSVYTGLIRVAESAPGTVAFQTNRNLKLSDDAWAYSVPNLEIEQNQVSCSHASAVGEIDEDQRFYLESRGVPTTVAEQLLVSGFFAEVIAKMPIDAVKAELQTTIDDAISADRHNQEVAP